MTADTTGTAEDGFRGWREAAQEALYGPQGFYRRPGAGPAAHFRTSVHASPLYARAVARLLCRVDEALGRPPVLDFVDMAAGRGELVTGVLGALPADVSPRVHPYAVELAARPPELDDRIEWRDEPPAGITGLLFANEWLDNVPVDVAGTDASGTPGTCWCARTAPNGSGSRSPERTPTGWTGGGRCRPRRACARRSGSPGPRVDGGRRHGRARRRRRRGLRAHRRGAPPFGTLTAFREGRETAPVPDGSRDLTAHVALDACAAAPALTGARLLTQRDALRALGVTGGRPPLSQASSDPAGYVRALAAAGEAAELTAPGGLGDFGWLVQPVGVGDVFAG